MIRNIDRKVNKMSYGSSRRCIPIEKSKGFRGRKGGGRNAALPEEVGVDKGVGRARVHKGRNRRSGKRWDRERENELIEGI